ncbi:Cyclin-like F-box [Mycena indigotica]|uniref:Cyclin-like F-box n=1 Tax=Mycena indigotica TaxID=2126181 RepID=A0A8H6S0E7_9AGAR|nr:Cyclin-like F-box [Mycena indigotica]KAF7289935.1 Cyclin-like F-box [Mycena indigotica]
MKSIFFFAYLAVCYDLVAAAPIEPALSLKNPFKGANTASKITALAAKVSKAKDGSTIIDDTIQINGLNLRFKVSAPASELVNGGNGNANGNEKLGINVLFHGDGGQSFFDFPNQGVKDGLMGVALLSPDANRRWGGEDSKDRSGLARPDGPAHSAAVNEFLTKTLPTIVNFDKSKIFLEGISGGSLLLGGFMIPTFGASLGVQGAILGCGGLEPQVKVQGDLSKVRLHFQSTTNELGSLKQSIPKAIQAYEKLIPGKSGQLSLVTADASIKGGHCEFDGKGFVSGIQLMTNNYDRIINGVSRVAQSVLGNENIFSAQAKAAAAAANGKNGQQNQNKTKGQKATKAQNNKQTQNKNNAGNKDASKDAKTVTKTVTVTEKAAQETGTAAAQGEETAEQ